MEQLRAKLLIIYTHAIVAPIMVVRMRHTRAQTANRRSHHALKAPAVAVCKNCEADHRPHHMCLNCGFYKGKVVIDLLAKKKAREARLSAKRALIRGEAEEAEPVVTK